MVETCQLLFLQDKLNAVDAKLKDLLCSTQVDVNEVTIDGDTLMHLAAEYSLTDSTNELMNLGEQKMLLVSSDGEAESWPLILTVTNERWSTVEVILERLKRFKYDNIMVHQ